MHDLHDMGKVERKDFRLSSRHWSQLEEICVFVKWIGGQRQILVARLCMNACVGTIVFGLSRESLMVLKRRLRKIY